jgi:hypothetical protein
MYPEGLDPDPVCSLEQHRVEEIFKYHEENFEDRSKKQCLVRDLKKQGRLQKIIK